MANLKYVCISDLHLGAAYSILTNAKNPLQQSEVLMKFAVALRSLVGKLQKGGPPPQLMLNGDILDLGLSPVADTAMGFQRLIEALYSGTVAPFSTDVLYVPGNHDHRVWQWVEGDHYAQVISTLRQQLPALEPVTPLFPVANGPLALVESTFLTQLMQNVLSSPAASEQASAAASELTSAAASVKLAYPNFAVSNAAGRCIVFHHGHFIESMYRMMSDLRVLLGLGGAPVKDVAELERENGAWIDFVWSTLGDAGRMGKDAGNLYAMLQDAIATEHLVDRLASRLVRHFQSSLPMGGEREVQEWARRIVRGLLDLTLQRSAEAERTSYETVLTTDSLDGLSWYLQTPLLQQFDDATHPAPADLVFIFGHTHKPFEDALPLPSYRRPVRLFNTGGWVLDEPAMATLEGAAMVLVDDELNVVSVRLFNQVSGGTAGKVHIRPGGAWPQQNNPLRDATETALAGSEWADFTKAVGTALAARERDVIRRYDLDPAGLEATSAKVAAR